jgi:hypothetical protein
MVNRSGGFVASVPIVTFVVGAALPLALWGAADRLGDPSEATSEGPAPQGAGISPGLWYRLSF